MEVALFITCLTDTFLPRVGEAVVRVLRHFGCRVRFPEQQTCCGQPAFNSGFHAEAAALARRTIRVFEPFRHVVTPSASCAALLRNHYPELLADDPGWRAAAERLAVRTHEFTSFLVGQLEVDIAAQLSFDRPVTFHYPCHARDAYGPDELHRWLARGAGAGLRPPAQRDLCCGFGGLFAVELPEISGAMLRQRLEELAGAAELVVCNEAGCTLSLAGGAHRRGLPLRFKHIAECLAESLGLLEPQR